MSQIITAVRPSGGQVITVDSVPGGTVTLSFDPAEATASREGNSLVFTFEHGGKVVLNDFFVVGDERLPDLMLPDGKVVASADFFTGSDLDISTAAGTASSEQASSGGIGAYGDTGGDLLSGIGRLGSLGTDYWGGNTGSNDIPVSTVLAVAATAPAGPETGAPDTASHPL